MFLPGLLLLLLPGILRSYLLLPFPGSQNLEAIGLAYYLERSLLITRIAGILLMGAGIYHAFRHRGLKPRIVMSVVALACLVIVFLTDFYLSAERMFREPTRKAFAGIEQNKVDIGKLVIGVEHNGVAKAYPINYLGYHHKVQDSVAGMPVLVTYCTMCRTGRVFSPLIDGRHQEFRLVGARHYNAIIEDQTTGSWWYQESGEAAAGPLRGSRLRDISYDQLTLRSWIERHPNTLILQPDSNFTEEYAGLADYDRGRRVQNDSSGSVPSWERKSWVIGVAESSEARAYNWNDLVNLGIINDRLADLPLVIALEADSASYHVWSRRAGESSLELVVDRGTGLLKDTSTGTLWNWEGECTQGRLRGTRLEKIPAHQEYWHSWQNFHKNTSRWMRGGLPAPRPE